MMDASDTRLGGVELGTVEQSRRRSSKGTSNRAWSVFLGRQQLDQEGKNAVKWTKLSCRTFKDNQTRLQLFALAYNLGNFLRRLALPKPVRHWSLTTLREKLIKIGAKVTRHSKYVTSNWPRWPSRGTCSRRSSTALRGWRSRRRWSRDVTRESIQEQKAGFLREKVLSQTPQWTPENAPAGPIPSSRQAPEPDRQWKNLKNSARALTWASATC